MQETNKFLIPSAIVVAGALVAGAIYYGDTSRKLTTNNQRPTTGEIEVPPITAQDHFRGSRDAELIVVEYSDMECPFCKTFHNTMNTVLGTYGTQVGWVYKQFPIAQLHARAQKEAEASECVAELGGNTAFWNYLDKIFETTNSNDSLDPAELPRLAGEVGVDKNAFNTCLESGRFTSKVQSEIDEAYKAGARGTPYSVIINKSGEVVGVINGAEPLANVRARLDALLK